MTIGERIKKRRDDFKITQTELAKRVGISKQTLYKYETNLITNIPSDTIEQLATVLKVSPGYLMGWEQSNSLPANNSSCLSSLEHQIIMEYRKSDEITKAMVLRALAIEPSNTKHTEKNMA